MAGQAALDHPYRQKITQHILCQGSPRQRLLPVNTEASAPELFEIRFQIPDHRFNMKPYGIRYGGTGDFRPRAEG